MKLGCMEESRHHEDTLGEGRAGCVQVSSVRLVITETVGKCLSCSADRVCEKGEPDPHSRRIVGTMVMEVLGQRKHVAAPASALTLPEQ